MQTAPGSRDRRPVCPYPIRRRVAGCKIVDLRRVIGKVVELRFVAVQRIGGHARLERRIDSYIRLVTDTAEWKSRCNATVAAVTVMQLVRARDGTTDQSLTDVFDPMDQPFWRPYRANSKARPHVRKIRTRE